MTECSKCGLCCERIAIGWNPEEVEDMVAGWENPGVNVQEDVAFIKKHWSLIDPKPTDHVMSSAYYAKCDMFDVENRLCMAHEDRPPVCKGYPWYGNDPKEYIKKTTLYPQCSFNADVNIMLPIVQIT